MNTTRPTIPTTPTPPPTPPPASAGSGGPRRWVRYLLAGIVVLLFAMWVYIFGFAPTTGAYRVRDDAWRTKADAVCAVAKDKLDGLADTSAGRIVNPTHEQILRHADLIDQATAILSGMLDQLQALPVTSDRDQLVIDTFLKYYREIISDRHRYTAALRTFQPAEYTETLLPAGGPVTNLVTDFTSGNNVKSCVPPGELGADEGN